MTRISTLLALVVITLGAPSSVLAQASQGNPPASSLDGHGGIMIGFSLGGGSVRSSACEGCDARSGLTFDGSLGWFVNPRLAVMFDVFGVTTVDAMPDEPLGLLGGVSTANALMGVASSTGQRRGSG